MIVGRPRRLWLYKDDATVSRDLVTSPGKFPHKSTCNDRVFGASTSTSAVWIKADDGLTVEQTSRKNAANICGTAPRASACTTPALKAWRAFVLHVQKHTCRAKCHMKNGTFQGNDFCKYLYPRPIFVPTPSNPSPRLNVKEQRFEYGTVEAEDQCLSPYVPEWLLAWGAQINVQYCTGPGFLSYITKYITKEELNCMISDTDALRRRENMNSGERFLQRRGEAPWPWS